MGGVEGQRDVFSTCCFPHQLHTLDARCDCVCEARALLSDVDPGQVSKFLLMSGFDSNGKVKYQT